MDLSTTPKDNGTVLGLFPPIRRGQTYGNLETQHRSAASPCRISNGDSRGPGSYRQWLGSPRGHDRTTVSG